MADQIRDEILSGRLPSGQRLVEAKIAGTLDVSRGPVREAFKLLCAEGLLEEEPRRGMYVVSLTPDDIREIYDLRSAIEGRAAQLLAASHRDADLDGRCASAWSSSTRRRPGRHPGVLRAPISSSTTAWCGSPATAASTPCSPATSRC